MLRRVLRTMTRMMLRFQRILKDRSYRPEDHYMRGPGPKSHARAQTQPRVDCE